MGSFFRVIGGTVIAVVLGFSLNRQGKDFSLLLGMAVCCMVLVVALSYMEPVVDFMDSLCAMADLDSDMVGIVLKTVGIGLVAEIANLFCVDSGNSGIGKAIQIFAGTVILWLSLPIMQALIQLVQQMLEGL